MRGARRLRAPRAERHADDDCTDGSRLGRCRGGDTSAENSRYPDWTNVAQCYSAVLDALRMQPGIEAAGFSTAPVLEPGWRIPIGIEGRPAPRPEEAPIVQHVTVSTGYFETFQVRLLSGRFFQDSDTATAEPVILVNESLAKRLFPTENALGRRIISTAHNIGPLGHNLMFVTGNVHAVPFRIIGIVADIQQAPIGQPAEPAIYHSHRQFPFRAVTLVARGQDTGTVVSGIRQALHSVDPALALGDVRTMNDRLMMATAAPRLLTAVLTTFAVLTGLLAASASMACWLDGQRTAARAGDPARARRAARRCCPAGHVQGLILAGGGVLLGLGVAQLAGRLLQQVLFETRTTDVVAMTGAAALLLTAALLACVAPALRAARVAPTEGMREGL